VFSLFLCCTDVLTSGVEVGMGRPGQPGYLVFFFTLGPVVSLTLHKPPSPSFNNQPFPGRRARLASAAALGPERSPLFSYWHAHGAGPPLLTRTRFFSALRLHPSLSLTAVIMIIRPAFLPSRSRRASECWLAISMSCQSSSRFPLVPPDTAVDLVGC